jgi:hypothetical protein
MSIEGLSAFPEPPDAERHVRWCGRWGRATAPGDPIQWDGRCLNLLCVIPVDVARSDVPTQVLERCSFVSPKTR